MNEWSDQALVLRFGLFHEYDLWIRVLCRKKGLCTFFAFGGAKSKKRFCGCIDVLNSLQCHVAESRNGAYINLQEATLLSGPRKLRLNWQNMGIAANCLRFVGELDISPENAGDSFALVEDLRQMFEEDAAPPGLTPFFFRLKMAAILGFAPDLATCGTCSKIVLSEGFFIPSEGRVYCPGCLPEKAFLRNMRPQRITGKVLDAMRHVLADSPLSWTEEHLTPAEIRSCARCANEFASYHLGIEWEHGGFRHV